MIEWEDLQYKTAERYGGQLPHPDTAAAIGAAYHRNPATVIRIIDRVATEYAEGGVRSPWGVLKSRVENIRATSHAAGKADNAEKAITRAEQRIRNELLHYDLWAEVEDELFGDRGTLRAHDTPQLRQRMHTHWAELRPLGEAVELEHETRMRQWAEQQAARQNPKAAA